MKYSEDNKPLSHYIHALMYKKQDEIVKLQRRLVTPFSVIKTKREELRTLETKFVRQIAWERENK